MHDDIQDDDQYRYGEETPASAAWRRDGHQRGDYLIGMGYRLLAECHVDGDPWR
ncbi:MAG: hypothetical protein R3C12_13815 [Planctomycetaceae bacterium]